MTIQGSAVLTVAGFVASANYRDLLLTGSLQRLVLVSIENIRGTGTYGLIKIQGYELRALRTC